MDAALTLPEVWRDPDSGRTIPGCTGKRQVAGCNVYRINGEDYLSTGTVLKLSPWGKIDHVPPQALEYGRRRGELVDEACRLADENDLDWEALDPKLRPYVEAWVEWRQGVTILETESLILAEDLRAFGYRDRAVRHPKRGVVVVDLKTSAVLTDRERLQVASYASNATDGCLLLQLGKDGRAREHWVDIPTHRQRFAHFAAESHAWLQQQEAR